MNHEICYVDLHFMTYKSVSQGWAICISYFYNEKVETLFKGVLDFDIQPHPGAWNLGPKLMAWKQTFQGIHGPNINAFWGVVQETYPTWET